MICLCSVYVSLIEMQEDSPIHNNLFIGLNTQQIRHVSALFYGAIFRSSMVTKEEIQQSPWGVLFIVGKLWTLETRSHFWQERDGGVYSLTVRASS